MSSLSVRTPIFNDVENQNALPRAQGSKSGGLGGGAGGSSGKTFGGNTSERKAFGDRTNIQNQPAPLRSKGDGGGATANTKKEAETRLAPVQAQAPSLSAFTPDEEFLDDGDWLSASMSKRERATDSHLSHFDAELTFPEGSFHKSGPELLSISSSKTKVSKGAKNKTKSTSVAALAATMESLSLNLSAEATLDCLLSSDADGLGDLTAYETDFNWE